MQHELWPTTLSEKLSAGFPESMVLLDCETTGGHPDWHRITEIGLLLVEQGRITGQWQTLVNPRQSLSPHIQRLTGITPAMLDGAPEFEEIAGELWQWLDNRTLVAHNVRFDLGFLKQAYARLGRRYQPAQVCSAKLSRRLFPEFKRHGLDALVRRFGLKVEHRHRAFDDAALIWQFFQQVTALIGEDDIRNACLQAARQPSLPPALPVDTLDQLPRAPGVYLFFDVQGLPLYVGKSVNIRDRVQSHFSQDYRNAKDLKMHAQIARIETRETLSDFSAQLLESQLIKQLNPVYNRRLKRQVRLYQLKPWQDSAGYLHLEIETIKVDKDAQPVHSGLFRSKRQAQKMLEKIAGDYVLCHKMLGLESWYANQPTSCFRHQLHKCLGACCHREPVKSYNLRVREALQQFSLKAWPWAQAILVQERSVDGQQVVSHLVDQWRYLGQVYDLSDLEERGLMIADDSTGVVRETANDVTVEPAADFDLDTYHILLRFLSGREKTGTSLQIIPLTDMVWQEPV